jgi:hypothetical protein
MLNDMLPPSGSAFSSGGAGWAQPNAANDINSKKLVKNSQTFRIPDTSRNKSYSLRVAVSRLPACSVQHVATTLKGRGYITRRTTFAVIASEAWQSQHSHPPQDRHVTKAPRDDTGLKAYPLFFPFYL